jgi:hypothetical protein
MLKGFEYETEELNEKEIEGAKLLASFFKKNVDLPYSETVLSEALEKERNIKLKGSRFRAAIHYIRNNNLCTNLIATNKGYFITYDQNKIKDYLSSLRGRIASMHKIYKTIEANMEMNSQKLI